MFKLCCHAKLLVIGQRSVHQIQVDLSELLQHNASKAMVS